MDSGAENSLEEDTELHNLKLEQKNLYRKMKKLNTLLGEAIPEVATTKESNLAYPKSVMQ